MGKIIATITKSGSVELSASKKLQKPLSKATKKMVKQGFSEQAINAFLAQNIPLFVECDIVVEKNKKEIATSFISSVENFEVGLSEIVDFLKNPESVCLNFDETFDETFDKAIEEEIAERIVAAVVEEGFNQLDQLNTELTEAEIEALSEVAELDGVEEVAPPSEVEEDENPFEKVTDTPKKKKKKKNKKK